MSDDQSRETEGQDQQPAEGAGEKKDRWDELMAKLDAITETLRKACDGEEPGNQGEQQGQQSQEEGQDHPQG